MLRLYFCKMLIIHAYAGFEISKFSTNPTTNVFSNMSDNICSRTLTYNHKPLCSNIHSYNITLSNIYIYTTGFLNETFVELIGQRHLLVNKTCNCLCVTGETTCADITDINRSNRFDTFWYWEDKRKKNTNKPILIL